jgi:hypothetical protein
MKRIIQKNLLAYAILLSTPAMAFSQAADAVQAVSTTPTASAELSKEEVVQQICVGKWHIAYLEIKGRKRKYTKDEIDSNWMAFKPNGTYDAEDDGDKYDGTWLYNHADKSFTTKDRDGVTKYTLIHIAGKELIVSAKMEGKLVKFGMVNQ